MLLHLLRGIDWWTAWVIALGAWALLYFVGEAMIQGAARRVLVQLLIDGGRIDSMRLQRETNLGIGRCWAAVRQLESDGVVYVQRYAPEPARVSLQTGIPAAMITVILRRVKPATVEA